MDKRYYINVKSLMEVEESDLPVPTMKQKSIFVTGWREWLPLIILESEV